MTTSCLCIMAAAFIIKNMNTPAGVPVVGPVVCCGMTINSVTAFAMHIVVCKAHAFLADGASGDAFAANLDRAGS